MQAMTVEGASDGANGIYAYDNSTVSGDLTSMKVTASGPATGIGASSSDVKLEMSGDMSVESKNSTAYGINAYNSSDVTFTGMQAMTVSGDKNDAKGISALGSTVSGDLTSMMVYNFGGDTGPIGIFADSGDVKLAMSGDLTVLGKGSGALGILATSSDVTFTGMKAMTVSGDHVYKPVQGIYASNSTVSGDVTSIDVTSASGSAAGISAVDSSDVTLTGTTSVVAAGVKMSNAIDSESNSVVSLEDDLDKLIAVSTDKSGADASVLKVSKNGKIRLNKATVKNLGSGAANSITAGLDYDGTPEDGSGVVDVTASSLSGDIEQTGTSGTLEVMLKNKSFLSGAANVTSGDGAISINVEGAGQTTGNNKDNGSVWEVTGDSDMKGSNTTLSSVLNNTGVVSFDHEAGGDYKVISTDQLTGQNGLYLMNTNIDNASGWVNGRQADQVRTVSGDASGVLAISNNDANVAAFESLMTTPLVYVASGDHDNTNFTLMSKQGDKYYELGAWKYDLEKIVNPDGSVGWYLVNHDLSAVSHAALNAVMMPDVWYLETNALFSQLGDYNVSRDDVSVWGYAVYNKLRVDNAIKFNGAAAAANFTLPEENEVEHVFRGLTGGIDKRLASDDNKQVFGGLMIGYGEGDYDFNYGDADDNSFHVGLYGVWRFSSGWYLAGLVKYNRYKTNLTANPYGGGSYSTDYTQNGFGVSAMAGRQFVNESGWFWEPQVELGWHHIGGADYTLSGMPVEIEGANSLRGRVGIGFGKKYVREDGSTLDLFVKASLVHEFDGETDVNLYTDANKTAYDPLTVDYGGTWGQYKAGINYNSGKDFNAHAAVTYEKGGDRESPIGFEVGLTWLTGPKAKARAEERKALEEEKKAAEEERLAAEEAERKAKDMAEREEKAKIAAEATIKEQKIEAQKKALEEKQARETVQEMTPAQKSELAKMAKELHMTVEQLANVMLETMKSILEKQGLLQK
jgi:outer membrane autotransporter protein